MKIAIQGHPTRGKEVIQILESLGGKNTEGLKGTYETFYYIDDKNEIGDDRKRNFPPTYKLYTLEEFEKEFPFKVGDKVTFKDDDYPYTIKSFSTWSDGDIVCEFKETGLHYSINKLKPYKEVKEERNITLTLDKAKEWYNKGGELKEIALQAFSEKELNPLPRSWEEFITNRSISGYYISGDGKLLACCSSGKLSSPHVCPSQKSAEAHLALIQLEQLRDCWWNGWKPTWNGSTKYAIKRDCNEIIVIRAYNTSAFLVFPTREMTEEFLKCFRYLIEKAGDLI